MMRYILALLIALFSFNAQAQSPADLEKYVTTLTKSSRVTGTENCTKASHYLMNEFLGMGYKVDMQFFKLNGVEGTNVLARKDAPLKTVLVVGAHYDSVRNCPGADDNASGVASVLMLAQLLKDRPTRHTISFQLYAGEEQGLLGSKYYCSDPLWPMPQHLFMLNLDMVGYLKPTTQARVLPVDSIFTELFKKYSFASEITLRNDPGSDNDSFMRKGIPVAFLHTGLHRNYHRPTDTADKLNYKGMSEICKYALDLIIALDKSDTPDYSVQGLNIIGVH